MKFSQELFDAICERIANGESLRSICVDEGMPNQRAVMRWLEADEALQQQYARSREQQADTIFDECLQIADKAVDPQIARLRIDTRKWMAGKMRPKVYGDKVALTDGEGGPLQVVIRRHAEEKPE